MIRVRGLVKSFGTHPALEGVDLDVGEGEGLVVVGPNGAGKTSLVRILAGLSRPTAGSVHVAGLDLAQFPNRIRRRVGFLSHQPLVYRSLSAEENLRFYGAMYDVHGLDGRISTLLEQVGLEPRRHDLVRTYSRGMKQRLAIARALLHEPPILLLDEPYSGLDQRATEMLDRLLQEEAASRTVLLTTLSPEGAWRLGHRICILVGGRVRSRLDARSWHSGRLREEYQRQTASGGG